MHRERERVGGGGEKEGGRLERGMERERERGWGVCERDRGRERERDKIR